MKKYISILISLTLLTTVAFATQITKKIEVVFNSVNIKVNNNKVGSENIVYKGITYVPLRDISEMLDKDVKWDQETRTAEINDKDIKKENPIVLIEMENGGKINLELYPEVAPNTVKNFISLIDKGFYNDLIFHRTIPGFMIQGGCPQGNGAGGPKYNIKGEFKNNGIDNNLSHKRGVISMARTSDYNSAGSQFFILTDDSEHLDDDYAAFGKVISGMNVVDKIVNVERDAVDKPKQQQKIKKITVDLKNQTYERPEVIK